MPKVSDETQVPSPDNDPVTKISDSGDETELHDELDEMVKESEITESQASRIRQCVGMAMNISATHGPLPPPEMLEKYEKIYPGTSKILLGELQKEGHARRLNGILSRIGVFTGQILGVLIIFKAFNVSMELGKAGVPLASLAAVITGLGSLVLSFWGGKYIRDSKRKK